MKITTPPPCWRASCGAWSRPCAPGRRPAVGRPGWRRRTQTLRLARGRGAARGRRVGRTDPERRARGPRAVSGGDRRGRVGRIAAPPARALAVLYAVRQAVEQDRDHRRAIAIDAGRPHHDLLMGWRDLPKDTRTPHDRAHHATAGSNSSPPAEAACNSCSISTRGLPR